MKNILYITLSILTITMSPFTSEAAEQEPITAINTYEEDITGDGVKELIELKGILLSKETKYFRDTWIDITSTSSKNQWKISYGGGYEPTLKFIDLNHNKVADLFFHSLNDPNDDHYNHYMHTLSSEVIKKIPQPKQWHVNGEFKDNFTIDINFSYDEKPISINIDNNRHEYVQLGIYSDNGLLTKPAFVHIDPISKMDPLLISKNKGYGIKTIQNIRGTKTHRLGSVESLWYFEKEKWVILRTEWIPN